MKKLNFLFFCGSSICFSLFFSQHAVAGTCSFSGDTTISSNCEGGTISSSDSTITINSGVTLDISSTSLTVNDGIDITSFINNGTISGGTNVQNFRAYRSNDIAAFRNNGTVTLNGVQSFYIYNNTSDPGNHGSFTNTGTWNSNGVQSFYSAQSTVWSSFTNSGSFTANGNQSFFLHGGGAIGTLSNSGTLTTNGTYSFYQASGYTISDFNNSGTWALGDNGTALLGTITTLTNTGTISGILNNSGTITTFNNEQGESSSAITYVGTLPTNYNIIINSASDFGKINFPSTSGSTTFGIYTGSSVAAGRYASVITGLSVGSFTGARSGTYGGYNWVLDNVSGSIWDLVFSSSGPSAADTQSSIQRLASGLRGSYNSASLISNFPNSNTYDCNLFDVKGMCISAGGRYSTVDNPSSNSTAAVVTLGYKVNSNIRIGGFLDQSVNTHSPTGIDISNKHPMMGAFAYWNQNADGLGYQVKLANAYQDKDLTTTRDVIGTSEAGTGKTSLNSRSYVSELSYAFMFKENTLVRPYFALRYTTIEQDA